MSSLFAPQAPTQIQYRPIGTALEVFRARDDEILVSGPAGTGKSRAILEKMHLCAEKYPGMRGVILRKTRESLTQAALYTWEKFVVPPGHPILKGPQRNMRQSYRYPNGSEIVIGGLDKSQKVMSTEYDMAYVQEAIEIDEADWENINSRLRSEAMPYQQLLADTNPSFPHHWLYQRTKKKKTRLLESKHEENPTLFDPQTQTWTPHGITYLRRLDALTGVRYQRLRLGLWVAAEGQVYEGWSRPRHIVTPYTIPEDWPRVWAIDFGFVNPFVWLAFALHPDDIMVCYREIYVTETLVEDVVPMIWDAHEGHPRPQVVICDHDAEDRETFKRHAKMGTRRAFKGVASGIQACAERLKDRSDGRPGVVFFENALAFQDPSLVERMKPTCTADEVDGYVWDKDAKQARGDVPVKADDHGVDAWRYATCYVDKISGGGVTAPPPQTNSQSSTTRIESQSQYGYRNKLAREKRYRRQEELARR